MKPSLVLLVIAALAAPVLSAPPAFELTIDNIMRGPSLVGYEPRAVRWSGDSRQIYFEWKQSSEPREKDFATYVVSRDNTGLRKMSEEEAKNAPPVGRPEQTKNKKMAVYATGGDLFLYDYAAGRRLPLTKTTDAEGNPHFTKDERHVSFTRSNNLYVMSLETGAVEQLTDIRLPGATTPAAPTGGGGGGRGGRGGVAAPTTEERKGTDSQEYLKKEERGLLDIVKRRAEKREEDEAKRKKENPRKPFNLTARQTVANLQLSLDGTFVIATVNEPGDGTKNIIVPNYVTESAYTEDINGRNKVGDVQNRTRIAILSVETGDVKWGRRTEERRAALESGLVRGREQGRPDGARQRQQGSLDSGARFRDGQDARPVQRT